MAFSPTKEQKAAIEAPAPLLVAAAAGSGKTAVLTERVFRLLSDTTAPVAADRLLIVTFTNAAAAEMRQRIENRLDEACRQDPSNRLLARQRILLDGASICTIDSFCIDLVREHFDELGVSPDFRVVDPGAMEALYEQAASETLAPYYEAEDPAFFALLDALGADYGDENLIDAIRSIYEETRQMAFPDLFLERALAQYRDFTGLANSIWAEQAFSFAAEAVSRADETIAAIHESLQSLPEVLEKYGDSLCGGRRDFETMQGYIAARDWNGLASAAAQFKFTSFRAVRGYSEEPLVQAAKQAREEAAGQIASVARLFYADAATVEQQIFEVKPHAELLLKLTRDYAERLWEAMLAQNILTFSSTEHLALKLLCEPDETGEVRLRAFAQQMDEVYAEVMVDEYQDVNELQDMLFYALSGRGQKLFAVGDVKQSIYGFRGADPSHFLRKQNTFQPYTSAEANSQKKVILNGNFRSRLEICNAVNYFFSLFMTGRGGGIDYRAGEALNPLADFAKSPECGVRLDILDCAGVEERNLVIEARHVAREIQRLMERGPVLRDRENPDCLRPVRYADIAILMRSVREKAGVYVEELRRFGIPVCYELEGYLETAEMRVITALLRTIDNPTRDVPLVTVLLSPIFGFTPDDVAKIRLVKRDTTLYGAVAASAAQGDQRSAAFLQSLQEYRRLAVTLSPARLLDKLYELTSYPEIVLAMEDGPRRRANLLGLKNHALAFEQGGGRHLGGFLAYLDQIGKRGLKSAAAASNDAVRLMSIHGSKGLQFPICIYACGSIKFNLADIRENVMLDEADGLAIRYCDVQNRVRQTTLPRELLCVKRRKKMLEEELRLTYVAMTRAEEQLYFVLSVDRPQKMLVQKAISLYLHKIGDRGATEAFFDDTNSFADWMLASALLHPDGQELRDKTGIPLKPVETDSHLKIQFIEKEAMAALAEETASVPAVTDGAVCVNLGDDCDPKIQSLIAQLRARFSYQYPYAALRQIEAKSSVSDIAEKAEIKLHSFTSRPAFLSKFGLTPAERGTAMHTFMQFCNFEALKDNLQDEIERLVEWEYLSEEAATSLDRKALRAFLEDDLFARIQGAVSVRREMRFLTELPAGRIQPDLPTLLWKEPVVVQGAIDCLFEKADGGLVVLDFKTDRIEKEDDLLEAYGEQLRIYGEAVAGFMNRPVRELLLYSFHLHKTIQVPMEKTKMGSDDAPL